MSNFSGEVINDVTNKMVNQLRETEDSFIFQTLRDFAYTNYQITVEKEELMYAIILLIKILMIGKMQMTGCSQN